MKFILNVYEKHWFFGTRLIVVAGFITIKAAHNAIKRSVYRNNMYSIIDLCGETITFNDKE